MSWALSGNCFAFASCFFIGLIAVVNLLGQEHDACEVRELCRGDGHLSGGQELAILKTATPASRAPCSPS